MINADFKLLVTVLAKRLTLVIEEMIRDAKTCAISRRSLHNSLYLMWNLIDRAERSRHGRVLIKLGQSKTFGGVNHRYLATFLTVAIFGLVFGNWIFAISSDLCLVFRVDDYLLEPFSLIRSVPLYLLYSNNCRNFYSNNCRNWKSWEVSRVSSDKGEPCRYMRTTLLL